MIGLRHTDEWVGLLVLVAGAIFFAAILQAGVLRDWFRPVSHLRIVLPEAGAAGLSVGADVEILGTQVGTVRRIVISPNQQMYAEAEIDEQARPFIRRDSRALIRRRYGIAGASFLDINRGTGSELDWNYAVIEATTERDPTENIGALIDQAREKVFPILDDLGRSVKILADVIERLQRGEGDVGRLLTDDTMIRNIEGVVAKADVAVSDLAQLASELQVAGRNVETLSQTINGPDSGIPRLLQRADTALVSLQQGLRDLALATQRAPQIVHNVELGSRDLPSLLTQTQQTAHELDQLTIQLRGLWLLGGGGKPPAQPARSPTDEVAWRDGWSSCHCWSPYAGGRHPTLSCPPTRRCSEKRMPAVLHSNWSGTRRRWRVFAPRLHAHRSGTTSMPSATTGSTWLWQNSSPMTRTGPWPMRAQHVWNSNVAAPSSSPRCSWRRRPRSTGLANSPKPTGWRKSSSTARMLKRLRVRHFCGA